MKDLVQEFAALTAMSIFLYACFQWAEISSVLVTAARVLP